LRLFYGCNRRGDPCVCDGTGLAEALLGLPGFRVLEVVESATGELSVTVETVVEVAGCPGCGVRAESQDRMEVTYRDLECFGRPVRLVWVKRRWRCRDADCEARTWTETNAAMASRVLLTRRAAVDVTVQVGRDARPVAEQARRFGVAWETVHSAVEEFGQPLVDDPDRVGTVRQLGVDETSYKKAKPDQATVYATGMIDLDRRIVIDLVEGRAGADLRKWLLQQPAGWLAAVKAVATDLTDAYRSGMTGLLDHARKVADGFHVVRVAQRCLDSNRRRVQQEQLGHRGRKGDPLYKIRKILLTGNERLTDRGRQRLLEGLRLGDPHDEVLGGWLAREMVRDIYLTNDVNLATVLLGRAIRACLDDDVPEIQALGRILQKWRTEILNHHRTGASNGPTEGMNLCIKKVKRAGHGYRCFDHYRRRVLLHAGGCNWDRYAIQARPIRTRCSPLR
jgi:transposase